MNKDIFLPSGQDLFTTVNLVLCWIYIYVPKVYIYVSKQTTHMFQVTRIRKGSYITSSLQVWLLFSASKWGWKVGLLKQMAICIHSFTSTWTLNEFTWSFLIADSERLQGLSSDSRGDCPLVVLWACKEVAKYREETIKRLLHIWFPQGFTRSSATSLHFLDDTVWECFSFFFFFFFYKKVYVLWEKEGNEGFPAQKI